MLLMTIFHWLKNPVIKNLLLQPWISLKTGINKKDIHHEWLKIETQSMKNTLHIVAQRCTEQSLF